MTAVEIGRLLADLTYVEHLIEQHTELQATKHHVYTAGQQVYVEVQGTHYEARAWRAAISGRIFPSHVDRHGVRRQLVVGTHVLVEVIERLATRQCDHVRGQWICDAAAHPQEPDRHFLIHAPQRGEQGGLALPLAVVLGAGGLFSWGFVHAATSPNGAWLVVVTLLAVLLALVVGMARHGRARDNRERQYTQAQLNRLGRARSGAHHLDGY